MIILQAILWICVALLFYTYCGYALLLRLVTIFKPVQKPADLAAETDLPAVTLVIPAYNEAPVIPKKIENCLELDYPSHLLEIIFITDGSTDSSVELVERGQSVRLLHQPERAGKLAAMRRAM